VDGSLRANRLNPGSFDHNDRVVDWAPTRAVNQGAAFDHHNLTLAMNGNDDDDRQQ
jgi:hypothetical protein